MDKPHEGRKSVSKAISSNIKFIQKFPHRYTKIIFGQMITPQRLVSSHMKLCITTVLISQFTKQEMKVVIPSTATFPSASWLIHPFDLSLVEIKGEDRSKRDVIIPHWVSTFRNCPPFLTSFSQRCEHLILFSIELLYWLLISASGPCVTFLKPIEHVQIFHCFWVKLFLLHVV